MKEYIVDTVFGDMFCKESSTLSEALLTELSNEDMEVISGDIIESTQHHTSMLFGFAKLKEPLTAEVCETLVVTPYVKFSFEIYNGGRNGDILNQMTNMTLYAPYDWCLNDEDSRLRRKIETRIEYDGREWIGRAFWEHTPTDILSGSELMARRFIEHVVSVSEAHRWAKTAKEKSCATTTEWAPEL